MRDHRLPFLLLLAACASGAEDGSVDSTASADTTQPAITTPHPDTLVASADLRCVDATEIHANYFRGAEPRVVLARQDTGMVLPQRESASGARYATDDGAIEWWNKGDSASFTFRGRTTQCGPAEGGIEF